MFINLGTGSPEDREPPGAPKAGEVLIRVKAFGLNRSELFTRQGLSPGVIFSRILGIKAVGLVEDAPGAEFNKGDVVAAAMGGVAISMAAMRNTPSYRRVRYR